MSFEKPEIVNYRIAKAKETLDEVIEVHIENKLWNTAINRLYYACFYAVTALLANEDIDTKTHSGAKQMFGLYFIKTGSISEELGEFYSNLFSMRQRSDYEDIFEYEKEDVLKLVAPATELISTIEKILSEG